MLQRALADGLAEMSFFMTFFKVVKGFIAELRQRTSLNILLMHDRDTNLFTERSGDEILFWRVASEISQLLEIVQGKNSVRADNFKHVMIVLCHEADDSTKPVKYAKSHGGFVSLEGLRGESIIEYVCKYLKVDTAAVPSNLRRFIARLTLGNPLFIRETLDNLLEQHLLEVQPDARTLQHAPLNTISIASWYHTAMVGGTTCLLESLEPLEAAVVKMSTCFTGPFSVVDLAASTCARKAEACFFDLLRLYAAIQKLVKLRIIQKVGPPEERPLQSSVFGETQFFQTKNQLVRAIGSSMLLDSQRTCVKRQALVGRALSKAQTARMSTQELGLREQHIPWYYEQAYRRMQGRRNSR